jgi:GNAT superfamily N-acetyltransferase
VVRRAERADGPAFLALVRALADYEKLPPPDADAEARLIEDGFGAAPRFELYVAVLMPRAAAGPARNASGDAEASAGIPDVVAYAATFTSYSTFLARPSLYLEDLFVAPRARRRGVASAMLRALEAVARERGCGRFEWTVLDWNVDAQALYEGFGAQLLPEWRLVRKVL